MLTGERFNFGREDLASLSFFVFFHSQPMVLSRGALLVL
jgi:hypothetical protein